MNVEASIVCAICLETLESQEVGEVNPKGVGWCHFFCAACILELFKTGKAKCPLDRRSIGMVSVYKNIKSVNSSDYEIYLRECKMSFDCK